MSVVRNFGLEQINFLSQSRSKVRKENCARSVSWVYSHWTVVQKYVVSLCMWTEQEGGIWWAGCRNEAGEAQSWVGGVTFGDITGRGDESSEAIPAMLAMNLQDRGNDGAGQLWKPGHSWVWMGHMGLCLEVSQGAKKVSDRNSVEASDGSDYQSVTTTKVTTSHLKTRLAQ